MLLLLCPCGHLCIDFVVLSMWSSCPSAQQQCCTFTNEAQKRGTGQSKLIASVKKDLEKFDEWVEQFKDKDAIMAKTAVLRDSRQLITQMTR